MTSSVKDIIKQISVDDLFEKHAFLSQLIRNGFCSYPVTWNKIIGSYTRDRYITDLENDGYVISVGLYDNKSIECFKITEKGKKEFKELDFIVTRGELTPLRKTGSSKRAPKRHFVKKTDDYIFPENLGYGEIAYSPGEVIYTVPEPMPITDANLLDVADDLISIARKAAVKLNAAVIRGEIHPFKELDELTDSIQKCDEFIETKRGKNG